MGVPISSKERSNTMTGHPSWRFVTCRVPTVPHGADAVPIGVRTLMPGHSDRRQATVITRYADRRWLGR